MSVKTHLDPYFIALCALATCGVLIGGIAGSAVPHIRNRSDLARARETISDLERSLADSRAESNALAGVIFDARRISESALNGNTGARKNLAEAAKALERVITALQDIDVRLRDPWINDSGLGLNNSPEAVE